MSKILMLNVLYTPNIGGVENSISEISKTLSNLGHHVDIVCSNRNNESNDLLNSFELNGNHRLFRYDYNFGRFSFLTNLINSVVLLRSVNKSKNYNHIISRSYFLVIAGRFAGLKKIKYIPPEVTFFSSKKQVTIKSPKFFLSFSTKVILECLAVLLSDEVYVFSDSMIEQIYKISLGFKKPTKVEPGINLNKFMPANAEEKLSLRELYEIPQNKKVLLALGRFSEVKQFDLAISAMQYLNNKYLLLIVGSGSELDDYENLISHYQLDSKVKILNSTNTPEELYKLSDAFIMTSKYESFGQTILEACASQLKIIGFSKNSGVNTNIESILSNYNQLFLVDKQSAYTLSKTISDAFSDSYINKEKTPIDSCNLIERYSWERFVKKIGIV